MKIKKYKIFYIFLTAFFLILINILPPISSNTPLACNTSLTNILYVGGTGLGNYSSIQSAINNANNGDVIFVYDFSSPYIENILINKELSIIGEDKLTTIIDGKKNGDVVKITVDWVNMSGFTVTNGSNRGILVNNSNYSKIDDIYCLDNNNYGIYFNISSNNIFNNSIFFNNSNGALLLNSSNNTFNNCTTISNSISDFYLTTNSSNNTGINTTFNNIYIDLNSEFIVKNYLHIQVKDKNRTPVTDADVQIKDNNKIIYLIIKDENMNFVYDIETSY